jgi:hypothetical protein
MLIDYCTITLFRQFDVPRWGNYYTAEPNWGRSRHCFFGDTAYLLVTAWLGVRTMELRGYGASLMGRSLHEARHLAKRKL